MNLFANSEEPDEMQHHAAFHQGLHFFHKKEHTFFFNYNLTPLDMYNGLSQVYCIEPEGRIHQYTKG